MSPSSTWVVPKAAASAVPTLHHLTQLCYSLLLLLAFSSSYTTPTTPAWVSFSKELRWFRKKKYHWLKETNDLVPHRRLWEFGFEVKKCKIHSKCLGFTCNLSTFRNFTFIQTFLLHKKFPEGRRTEKRQFSQLACKLDITLVSTIFCPSLESLLYRRPIKSFYLFQISFLY